MTVAPRQPSRKALYLPFVLLLIAAVAWTLVWFWMRVEAREGMDARVDELRAAGYTVAWRERSFGGYPFRLDAKLTDFRMAEPTGWGIEAPEVRAEAFVYAMDHWVAVAPKGVVLHRPIGGPLAIQGKGLRASLTDLDRHPPRVAVEGAELTFQPVRGGEPFLLQSAEALHLHLRPGPEDQAAVLFRAQDARARLPGRLEGIGRDRPVDINIELILSNMSAMQGRDWRTMAQRWAASGGTATVRSATLGVGGGVLAAHGGALSVGPDGRVEGGMTVDLARAGEAVSELTGGLIPPGVGFGGAPLTFEAGQTSLGPLPIAPAPRVY